MKRSIEILLCAVTAVSFVGLMTTACGSKPHVDKDSGEDHPSASKGAPPANDGWTQDFNLDKRTLSTDGEAPYFVLKPGYQIVLADDDGDDKVEITVLDETEKVGNVNTRVVEEREWENKKLVEVSRNYFAIDNKTKDVFYFGENVDIYKNDKVVDHEGGWRADQPGNKAGLAIPGSPTIGEKYYQEYAPGVALDRGEIVSLTEELTTPAGKFSNCVKTKETSGLKASEKEFKHYAKGIGQIQDEDLLLTKYGYLKK